MNTQSVIAVIVVIILVAGGAYYFSTHNTPAVAPVAATTVQTQQQTTPVVFTSTTTSTTTVTTTSPKTVTVTYTPTGFSPKTVTINKGDTVTFISESGSDPMWVASNPHPTHQGYDGTTEQQHCATGYSGPAPFDQCSMGATFSFTFGKIGSWGYHNHGNPSDGGTVIVH